MTSWIDTNVLVALWDGNPHAQEKVRKVMTQCAETGWFAVGACVYAELCAGPGRTMSSVTEFLREADIPIAWQTGEDVWRLATERFSGYSERRRANGAEPKRLLADFLIGAQATVRSGRLMTFDQRIYATAFPELQIFGDAVNPS